MFPQSEVKISYFGNHSHGGGALQIPAALLLNGNATVVLAGFFSMECDLSQGLGDGGDVWIKALPTLAQMMSLLGQKTNNTKQKP